MSSLPNPEPGSALDIRRCAHGAAVFVLVFVIRCYQAIVRPLLIGSCKFHPTCSEYGIQALQLHGLWRGSILIFRRVCRCRPFTAGGIDPVPEPGSVTRRRAD